MQKLYPLGKISSNRAWAISGQVGKSAPYRGQAHDLGNGQYLAHNPDGSFEIKQVSKPESVVPTLDGLKAIVREAGYTVSAGSWEDERNIYAFSRESTGEHAHPDFAASYHKETRWLSVDGKAPIQL